MSDRPELCIMCEGSGGDGTGEDCLYCDGWGVERNDGFGFEGRGTGLIEEEST